MGGGCPKGKTASILHMPKTQADIETVRTKVTLLHLAKGPLTAEHLLIP